MKITSDHLLLLVREHGVEKALRKIDVEMIDDHNLKVIARTAKYSCDILHDLLVNRAYGRADG